MDRLRNIHREGLALAAIDSAIAGHRLPEIDALVVLYDAGWRMQKVDDGRKIVITLTRPDR